MKSVQEVFDLPQFRHHRVAAVQRMDATPSNLSDVEKHNRTQWWDRITNTDCTLLIASLRDENEVRTLYAGTFLPPKDDEPFDRVLRVDKFIKVGSFNRDEIPDAEFYGLSVGGGNSRTYVNNTRPIRSRETPRPPTGRPDNPGSDAPPSESGTPDMPDLPPGVNHLRLAWVRENHNKFARAVRAHWNHRCAVHDHSVHGLLVASHILPWSTNPDKRTDPHNGILLSAPLDALFDAFLISFADDGELLVHPTLDKASRAAFGLRAGMRLREGKMTAGMRKHLTQHRKLFKSAYAAK